MKQLFKLLGVFTFLGLLVWPISLKAETQEVTPTWGLVETVPDVYIFNTDIDKPIGTKTLLLDLPESDLTTCNNSGLTPMFKMYDSSDVLIEEFNLCEYFGTDLNDTLFIDFVALGYWLDFNWQSVSSIYIQIPQTFSSPPSGIFDYWNDSTNNSMIFNYEYNTGYYFIKNVNHVKTSVKTSDTVYSITLDLTNMFNLDYELIDTAFIKVKDDTEATLETIYLNDLTILNPTLVKIDLSLDGYTADEVERFDIYLNKYEEITSERLIEYNTDFNFLFNTADVVQVNYVSQGVIINEGVGIYGKTIDYYEPTEIEGYEFIGWTDKNDVWFNSSTGLDESMLVDSNIYLYANYQKVNTVTPVVPIEPSTPTEEPLNALLNVFGLDNVVGYILFYVGLMIIVTVGLLWVEVPLIVIASIDLLITIIVTYWGILPFFVTVIAYLLMALMFTYSLKGVNSYE
jgi:hypothetical protein